MDIAIIKQRIADLRREQASGENMMKDLEAKIRDLQHTLMRINGAITVLEELAQDAESRN